VTYEEALKIRGYYRADRRRDDSFTIVEVDIAPHGIGNAMYEVIECSPNALSRQYCERFSNFEKIERCKAS